METVKKKKKIEISTIFNLTRIGHRTQYVQVLVIFYYMHLILKGKIKKLCACHLRIS